MRGKNRGRGGVLRAVRHAGTDSGAACTGTTLAGAGAAGQDRSMSVVLQKGSITGTVTMDGTKVGELVAPIVDMEIEQSRKESAR